MACAASTRRSWPRDRELHALRLARLGFAADRQHLGQNAAGIARVDHPVVGQARAGREYVHLAVEYARYLRSHRVEFSLFDRLATTNRRGFRDDRPGPARPPPAPPRGLSC